MAGRVTYLPGCLTSARATPRGLLALLGAGESSPYLVPKSRISARVCAEQNITLFLADYTVFLAVFIVAACVYRPSLTLVLVAICAGCYWVLTEVDRVHDYHALLLAYSSRTRRRSSSTGFKSNGALSSRVSGSISSAAAAYLDTSASSSSSSAMNHARPDAPLSAPDAPVSVLVADAVSPYLPAGPRTAAVVALALSLSLTLLLGGLPLLGLLLLWLILAAAHACTRSAPPALASRAQPLGPGRAPAAGQRLLLLLEGALVHDSVPQASLSAAYEGSPRLAAMAAAAAGHDVGATTGKRESLANGGDVDDDEEAANSGEHGALSAVLNSSSRSSSRMAASAPASGSVLVPPLVSPSLALSSVSSSSSHMAPGWGGASPDLEAGPSPVPVPFTTAGSAAYPQQPQLYHGGPLPLSKAALGQGQGQGQGMMWQPQHQQASPFKQPFVAPQAPKPPQLSQQHNPLGPAPLFSAPAAPTLAVPASAQPASTVPAPTAHHPFAPPFGTPFGAPFGAPAARPPGVAAGPGGPGAGAGVAGAGQGGNQAGGFSPPAVTYGSAR